MRNYLLNIGGMVAGAVVITMASSAIHNRTNAALPPELPSSEQPVVDPQPVDSVDEPDVAAPESPDTGSETLENNQPIRGDQKFVLHNDRAIAMYYFHASPNAVSSWENDILDESVLMPGETTTININDDRQTCMYDFSAVFEDGSESAGYDVNICNLDLYTFN